MFFYAFGNKWSKRFLQKINFVIVKQYLFLELKLKFKILRNINDKNGNKKSPKIPNEIFM
jgi:hypothetical protein